MKKILSGVLMILMSTSCIFFIWDTEPSGKTAYWYIKNSTDIPLSVSWVKDTSEYLSVGDSLCIQGGGMYQPLHPPRFKNSMRFYDIYVYDEEGNELCRWVEGEIQEGQRDIYKEKYWTHYRDSSDYIWVFDIIDEDFAY